MFKIVVVFADVVGCERFFGRDERSRSFVVGVFVFCFGVYLGFRKEDFIELGKIFNKRGEFI